MKPQGGEIKIGMDAPTAVFLKLGATMLLSTSGLLSSRAEEVKSPAPKGMIVIKEGEYPCGLGASPNDCKDEALKRVQVEALKEIGTAILSEHEERISSTDVKDFSSVKDRLIVISGGVAKVLINAESWTFNPYLYHYAVKVAVDPEEVRANLSKVVAEWRRNRAEVLEKLAAAEGRPASAQGAVFTGANFNKCLSWHGGRNASTAEECVGRRANKWL